MQRKSIRKKGKRKSNTVLLSLVDIVVVVEVGKVNEVFLLVVPEDENKAAHVNSLEFF